MFPIARVQARRFLRFADQGSTEPMLFEDQRGDVYLIKVGSSSIPDHVMELLAALLAPSFGVKTPDFAIMDFQPDLLSVMGITGSRALGIQAAQIRRAGRCAFASRWCEDASSITPAQLAGSKLASQIYWFDLFINNTDRSQSNPNLIKTNGEIIAIDHAQGFPYLLGAPPRLELSDHICFPPLSPPIRPARSNVERLFDALPNVWREQLPETAEETLLRIAGMFEEIRT